MRRKDMFKLSTLAGIALLALIMLLPDAHAQSKATLITNGFAYRHPDAKNAAKSPDWVMTAGSLFKLPNGMFWTGTPDSLGDDAQSQNTHSAVFRMASTNHAYGDARISIKFNLSRFVSTPGTPEVAWDGIHVMLRYQSQYELYYVSVMRRDDEMVIKKKCPGGLSNGGTYYEISPEIKHKTPIGTDASFTATVQNISSNAVRITLYDDKGNQLLMGEDHGMGCAPITQPGAIGVRGDNAEFMFNLQASPLH